MKTIAKDYAEALELVAFELDPLAFQPMRGPGPRGMELASEETRQLSHQHRATYAKQKAARILRALGIFP